MVPPIPSWSREDDGMAPDCEVEGAADALVPVEGVRGRIVRNAPLAPMVWFKAGGTADWLFEPADLADLEHFLSELDGSLPVMALGLGSNLIVRDGGVPGVTIRLGKPFAKVEVPSTRSVNFASSQNSNPFSTRSAAERMREFVESKRCVGGSSNARLSSAL